MKNLSTKAIVTIGVLIILAGILLLSSNYLAGKKEAVYEEISISLLSEKDGQTEDNTPQNIEKEEVPEEPNPTYNTGDYLGILEIPKINLNRGFYDKNNEYNNISHNVTLLEPSNYPDEKKGNVILVAHSGSSYIGFFKHLYQLIEGDIAYITYKNHKYEYKIVNIYNENKDGDVTIYRNKNKQTLTLVTCTKDSDTLQTIYIFELQNIA